jgi:murein biosynthesis integral membrane protein MurJ
LVRGGVIVAAGVLAGNFTGFFRVAVTAYLLGTHARADALATAVGPLDSLNLVIVNTLLFAFVPMLMQRDGAERMALFVRGLHVYTAMLAVLTAGIIAFAPEIAAVLGPGLSAERMAESVVLVQLMAPGLLFAGIGTVYAALLYTERRFIPFAFYQLIQNVLVIATALLLWKELGIYGFAVGYSAGAFIQMVITWHASREMRRNVAVASSSTLRELLTGPAMFLMYAGLVAANIVVTRSFSTHAGAGMAAAFDYANRCVSVLNAWLVYPLASTLLPEIAALRGARDTRSATALIDKTVFHTAIAAVGGGALLVLFRVQVIRFLFERGSFTPESTQLVSSVFLGYAVAAIGWTLLDLIARCFFALNRPLMPVIAACVPVTLNVLLVRFGGLRPQPGSPVITGIGAAAGFVAGFVVIFFMMHVFRERAAVEDRAQLVGFQTVLRLQRYFRRRRMQAFISAFQVNESTRILDVGGTPGIWDLLDVRPRVTLLNTPGDEENGRSGGRFPMVLADGLNLPFRDCSFDIVFSNSVIEHVGSRARQETFAGEVRRVARSYWVQTPNRFFPIETHLWMPLVHLLPKPWCAFLIRRFTIWELVFRPRPDQKEHWLNHFLEDIRLLSGKELKAHFPDAAIRRERWLFFTKSLIAVRRS